MSYRFSGPAGFMMPSGAPARDVTDADLERLPPRAHRDILASEHYTHDGGAEAVYEPPATQESFPAGLEPEEEPVATGDDDDEGEN